MECALQSSLRKYLSGSLFAAPPAQVKEGEERGPFLKVVGRAPWLGDDSPQAPPLAKPEVEQKEFSYEGKYTA